MPVLVPHGKRSNLLITKFSSSRILKFSTLLYNIMGQLYPPLILTVDFTSPWLKLVVCILLRVLGQVQGFRLTQHWFEYFISA
jgi:hypothetical protein